jgi:hypothetical protein
MWKENCRLSVLPHHLLPGNELRQTLARLIGLQAEIRTVDHTDKKQQYSVKVAERL